MKIFNLPDLGEGLPDAEIVEWLVAEGDQVELDQPMVSMETAKAVVEVPSPYTGTIVKLHGDAGDVIDTGAALVTFEVAGEENDPAPPMDETDDVEKVTLESDEEPSEDDAEEAADEEQAERQDAGTVVGAMETSDEIVQQTASDIGGIKVTTAVRALARKHRVDLTRVSGSGEDGEITADDVRAAAERGDAVKPAYQPPSRPAAPVATVAAVPSGKEPPPEGYDGLRGTRRTMARTMSASHAAVVPTTIMDDADLHRWDKDEDIMARVIRALCKGVEEEPALNAWFDGASTSRKIHDEVHVGMAVDTPDGLFVSTLRDVGNKKAKKVRKAINKLRDNVKNRSIPPEDLSGYTIMLSNFGVFAGRYASPVIAPPCVAILATGKKRDEVVAHSGGLAVHPVMPLSLTFDHRAVTGGEASRFLGAVIKDLQKDD